MASASARTGLSVAQRFGRRAREYERHAHLQRLTAETLAAFVGVQDIAPGPVVEIGCGTGLLTRLLASGDAPYLATDIAPDMVAACRAKTGHLPGLGYAVMDGQRARFAQMPALIVSNLTFQWFADPVAGIAALAGQTRALAFSVLLAGSFPEWSQAFADLGRTSGLIPLPEEQAVLRALGALPGLRLRQHTLTHVRSYDSAKAFVHSFRGIGADHPRPGYRPGPIRPVLERFAGGMDATARVLYCVAQHDEMEG